MRSIVLLVVLLAGCGRPATADECEVIVERIARLELEQRGLDAETVAQEIERSKAALRESTFRDCVGKRVTDGSMRCVREAKTTSEIVNQCFSGWK